MDRFAGIDGYLAEPQAFKNGVPHAMLKTLRDEDPVHLTTGKLCKDFWSVTRYGDIEAILLDEETFSSELAGNHLPESAEAEMAMATPEVIGCGNLIVRTDEPKHRKLRLVMNHSLSSRVVATFEPLVRDIVVETIESVRKRGKCDFVKDIALHIPLRTICDIMGVPENERVMVMRYTEEALFAAEEEFAPEPGDAQVSGFEKVLRYSHDLALKRRQEPKEDVTTVLALAQIDGELWPEDLLSWNVAGFIMGGVETTRNAISGGVVDLIRNAEQVAKLRADPSLMPAAVEEVLRFSSAITHLLRVATRDVELHGRQIRKGDWVVCWLASANRDESVFPEPNRMDITRQPNLHAAFGHGAHFCIGRMLARLEIRITIEELLERLPNIEIDGPIDRLTSYIGAGIKRMPIRF